MKIFFLFKNKIMVANVVNKIRFVQDILENYNKITLF